MQNFINQLRQKPLAVRQRYAALASLLITTLIVVLWLASFAGRSPVGAIVPPLDDPARVSSAPLEFISRAAARVGRGFSFAAARFSNLIKNE